MQRFNYFFRQKVTEGELDAGFDAAEQMEFNLHLAQGLVGVQSQATVTENSGTPNLTVDISGPAEIRDQLGQRVAWTPTQDLDCSVDENSNPTAVGTPGNERYLSIFAKFVRVLSDPRLDGAGDLVQHNRAEGFQINVVQGAEAALATAVRPGLRADEVLLADVLLVNGQTQILNADILTNRREDAFVVTDGATTQRSGTAEQAIQALANGFSLDDVVHKAGTETITGPKTLTKLLEFSGLLGPGGATVDPLLRDIDRLPVLSPAEYTKVAEFLGSAGSDVRVRLWVQDSGLAITANANFDNATNEYVSDASGESTLLSLNRLGGQIEMSARTAAAGGERWAVGAWTRSLSPLVKHNLTGAPQTEMFLADGVLEFNSPTTGAGGSNLGATAVIGSNQLRAKNTPKVWGTLTTDGAGGVTIDDGYGLNAVSINGTGASSVLRVTMSRTLANVNYAVVATASSGELVFWSVNTKIATRFDLQALILSTDLRLSLDIATAHVDFMVFGED